MFARYDLHGPVRGCPCCTSDADDRRLRAKPLRDLSGDDLSKLAFEAVALFGTVEDLKHFLPRMLEVATRHQRVGNTDFEIMCGTLGQAGLGNWPAAERTAVEQYLGSLWDNVLSNYPSTPDVDSCLCGIGRVVDDLTPYLDVWLQNTSVPALRQLAEYVDENAQYDPLRNPFWADRSPQMRQVIAWLRQHALSAHLEAGFFRHADEPFADELSEAVKSLGTA